MRLLTLEQLMSLISVVGVAGNIARPSRTAALVSAIISETCSLSGAHGRLIELADVGPQLFQQQAPEQLRAFAREHLGQDARSALAAIEAADALVVGTPVYKGSYTGALKHLFDLIPPNALAGRPVLLAATAGSPLHGLVTEHQLRPLFGFFNARTVPTTIFALETDFHNFRIEKPEVLARIKRAAGELVEWLPRPSAYRSASAELATA
jgi:FMN reductase